jgi:hypothetical protein
VVAPGKVGFSFESFYGSSPVAASVVGETALFVQGRGTVLRDLGFQFTKDGYTGNDLTVFASHLLEGFQIVDMAFQQVPYSAVWIVRSDGKLISVTYLREQEVVGWALHETAGRVVSVCTVPEGDHNALYLGVVRRIGTVDRTSIEVMDDRDFINDQRDAFFVDCGLSYDGRFPEPAMDLVLTSPSGLWGEDEQLTLTSSGPLWVGVSDVGDHIRLSFYNQGSDATTTIEVIVLAFVSDTEVTVGSIGTVLFPNRGTVATSYEVLRDSLSGLDHLEGMTVAVLADGSVQKQKVVVGGRISLDVPAAVVHVGLPYRSDIESLDINVQGTETVRDRPKLISSVTLQVKDSRGLKAGPDLDRLEEVKTEFDAFDNPIALQTGIQEFSTSADWNKSARFVVVQEDPLPATILGLIPHVTLGGT